MNWLLGLKSKLSTSNKLLIYKTILKPIWTYGTQLWGTASTSNIKILERFQSKALRMIVDTPWYVPNTVIRRDQSSAELTTIFYFSHETFSTWRSRSPYLYPSGTGWTSYTPGYWIPFSYDSQSCGGGILTCLQTGTAIEKPDLLLLKRVTFDM
jgi:hypothetical protein